MPILATEYPAFGTTVRPIPLTEAIAARLGDSFDRQLLTGPDFGALEPHLRNEEQSVQIHALHLATVREVWRPLWFMRVWDDSPLAGLKATILADMEAKVFPDSWAMHPDSCHGRAHAMVSHDRNELNPRDFEDLTLTGLAARSLADLTNLHDFLLSFFEGTVDDRDEDFRWQIEYGPMSDFAAVERTQLRRWIGAVTILHQVAQATDEEARA